MLLVVAIVAGLVYAAVWAFERRRGVGRSRPRRPKPRMIAPDDDDDFLRSLHPREESDEDDPEDPQTKT